jgi:hypothetical protein
MAVLAGKYAKVYLQNTLPNDGDEILASRWSLEADTEEIDVTNFTSVDPNTGITYGDYLASFIQARFTIDAFFDSDFVPFDTTKGVDALIPGEVYEYFQIYPYTRVGHALVNKYFDCANGAVLLTLHPEGGVRDAIRMNMTGRCKGAISWN